MTKKKKKVKNEKLPFIKRNIEKDKQQEIIKKRQFHICEDKKRNRMAKKTPFLKNKKEK